MNQTPSLPHNSLTYAPFGSSSASHSVADLVKPRSPNTASTRDKPSLCAYPHIEFPVLTGILSGKSCEAKFITTLNLSWGYWQEPDKPKTAFTTLYGLFQLRVMLFGLQGAPGTFQRIMDIVLDGLGVHCSLPQRCHRPQLNLG